MRHLTLALWLILFAIPCQLKAKKSHSSTSFCENKGQIVDQANNQRKDVLYYGEANGLSFYLKRNGISYQQYEYSKATTKDLTVEDVKKRESESVIINRLDISWLGASNNAKVVSEDKLSGVSNFYNVSDPSGVLGVKSFQTVCYKNLYKNIDLKYYHKNGSLKYDFIVNPAGNPNEIKLKINGATSIHLNKDGSVTFITPIGSITEEEPLAYQSGKRIEARWVISDNNVLSFEIPEWDKSRPLIIDPLVKQWGTYFGGTNTDDIRSTSVDINGNIFVAGKTSSLNNIATVGSHQVTIGGNTDLFVAKFDNSGLMLWSTYYGGTANESNGGPGSCASDASGNLYLCGTTLSTSNIATTGAHQVTTGGAFLVKFNTSGIRQWGTYYGGLYDFATSCAVDGSGDVYMAGGTESTSNISTPGAFKTSFSGGFPGFEDAFLVKFSSNGIRQWGTYYGDIYIESASRIVVSSSGDVYMAGTTSSLSNIATIGTQQPTKVGNGYYDFNGFIVKFNSSGIRQWGTYFGNIATYIYDCTIDNSGNLYACGRTQSGTSISFGGSFQPTYGGGLADGFLARFTPNGMGVWSTYYGGNGEDISNGCAVTNNGYVYLVGHTTTSTGNAISTLGSYQPNFAGGVLDGYIIQFDTAGSRLWGSYYGGLLDDQATACTIDNLGNVLVNGVTSSVSGIASLTGAYQSTLGGSEDGFLVKFTPCFATPVVTAFPGTSFCQGNSVQLSTPVISGATYQWYKDSSPIAGASNNTYTSTQAGSYNVVFSSSSCSGNSLPVVLTTNPLPATQINKVNVLCNGGTTGSISVSPMGSTGPLTYNWVNISSSSSAINNLAAGTYIVTSTTQNTCSKNDTVVITQPSAIANAKSQTNVSCFGGNNGSASILISGGVSPYLFLWSTSASSTAINNLAAGTYTVVVTDNNSCARNDTFIVTQPISALSTNISVVHNNCFGDSAGKAWATSVGGTGTKTYKWLNSASTVIANSDTALALLAGTYYLVTEDANQCTKTDTVSIMEPSQAIGPICAVTADSTTGKNLIIWEKSGIQKASVYKVYRESSVGGQYNLIGSVLQNQMSVFLDTSSNPLQQSNRYKLAVVDSCNNESPMSLYHKTIHLTANVGVSNEVNLIWNVYEGKAYGSHYIMRSVNSNPFTMIAEVSSSTTSYSDLTPPTGNKQYRIDIDLSTSCNPTAKTTGYNAVSSNVAVVNPLGIVNTQITNVKIVPNPTSGIIHIIGPVPARIKITDAIGRFVIDEKDKNQLSLSELSSGVYLVQLYDRTGRLFHQQKVVRE